MPTLTPEEAVAALKRYPNKEDVDFARQQDDSYGKPYAPYFNRQAFHMLDAPPGDMSLEGPYNSRMYNPSQSRLPFGETADVYAKAALAAKRSALASLGFDPSKATMDVTRNPENVNILGAYSPSTDSIYSNARAPSNLMHESIHRGITELKGSPFWKKDFDRLGTDQESVVRWLMESKMGNPEAKIDGDIAKEQRDAARKAFDPNLNTGAHRTKILGDMEAAAAKYIAAKTPGGPR